MDTNLVPGTTHLVPVMIHGVPRWKLVIGRVKKALEEARLISLPPSRFRPMRGQPREYFDPTELSMLEQSMRETGQIQDALCRPVPEQDGADHEILDGERRWRCAMKAGLPLYRAKCVNIDDEAALYVIAAITNFNRSDNTPMEKSNAIEKLHTGDLKIPVAEIAKLLGITNEHASRLRSLQRLPQEVKDMLDPRIQKGKGKVLPTSAGIELARLHDPVWHPQIVALAKQIMAKEMKLTRLRLEVDRLLSMAGNKGAEVGERHQPARKWHVTSSRISLALENLIDAETRMKDLLRDRIMPTSSNELQEMLSNLTNVSERCSALLKVAGQN